MKPFKYFYSPFFFNNTFYGIHKCFYFITNFRKRIIHNTSIRKSIINNNPIAIEIPGRDVAIKKAISFLKDDDVLIIAGKGHEQTQTIGIETLPFDDVAVVKNTLDRLNP